MFSAKSVDVFTDIGFREAKLIGQDECLAIFSQALPPILVQRMDRHGEETQFHRALAPERRIKAFIRIMADIRKSSHRK